MAGGSTGVFWAVRLEAMTREGDCTPSIVKSPFLFSDGPIAWKRVIRTATILTLNHRHAPHSSLKKLSIRHRTTRKIMFYRSNPYKAFNFDTDNI